MKKNPNKIRRRADEKALHAISVVLVTIFTLMCLYPFWNVFINSIATKAEAARGVYFRRSPLSRSMRTCFGTASCCTAC